MVKNYPSGMGSPMFDKLEAELLKACMSSCKGFEIGSGFEELYFLERYNDEFTSMIMGTLKTNRSGGIQGGISNSENAILHRI